ncbi:MAG: methylated-DNA--[protein]-cysteine S-methyltransferase [Treponema sp.]|nr:methylated-DNA--[protein]-cysteine S-methyltransferase [Treponema sp.]
MHYTSMYISPVGEMLLAADETSIVGAWFKDGKHYARCLDKENEQKETPIIKEGKYWLDSYFQGKNPGFEPPIRLLGTPFQVEVWNLLHKIPYGETTTYKEIARCIAERRGLKKMSARAVGTAIGKNNISLIVPCHRVVGANNSLAGYAGGIDKKIYFLKLEGGYKNAYFVPKHIEAS